MKKLIFSFCAIALISLVVLAQETTQKTANENAMSLDRFIGDLLDDLKDDVTKIEKSGALPPSEKALSKAVFDPIDNEDTWEKNKEKPTVPVLNSLPVGADPLSAEAEKIAASYALILSSYQDLAAQAQPYLDAGEPIDSHLLVELQALKKDADALYSAYLQATKE